MGVGDNGEPVYDGSEPPIGCTMLSGKTFLKICRVESSDFVPNKFGTCGDGCECPDGKVKNGKGACKEQCECDVNSGEVTCYKDDDDGACVPDCDGYLTGSSYSTEFNMCVCPEGKTDMGDGACVDDTS